MNDGIIFEDVLLLAVPPCEELYESMLLYFNNNSIPIYIEKPNSSPDETHVGFTVAGRCRIKNGFMIGSVVSDVDNFHTKYEYYSVGFVVDKQRYIIIFKEKETGNEGS